MCMLDEIRAKRDEIYAIARQCKVHRLTALRHADEYGIISFVKFYERSCRANYQASVGFEELPRGA